METVWKDLKYGLRTLGKNPGFTAVVVLTLALGIGANTAIFSVVNAVLLRPLPYSNPGELVSMTGTDLERHIPSIALSFTKFGAVRDQSQSFSAVAAVYPQNMTLTALGEPQVVSAARVSIDFFRVLGFSPARGRDFLPQEDQPGGNNVALITDAFWHGHFGGDPAALEKTITVDGNSTAIIGVLPPGFRFPFQQPEPEIWIPRVFEMNLLKPIQVQSGAGYLAVIARLRPGTPMGRAQAELDTISSRYGREFPSNADAAHFGLGMTSLEESLVGPLRPSLLVLLAAVGFVLLIACANVTSLLVARATAREKEIAIRRAMGASRLRLIRQLLTESLLLSFAGGGLGILFAAQILPLLNLVSPGTIPRIEEIRIDGAVLFFSLALCCLTGLAFGLVPALQAARKDLHDTLKEGGRGSTGGARGGRFRRVMVVAEVAVALMLVTGSGLLLRSFVGLMRVNPGFDSSHVLTFALSLPSSRYPAPAQQADFYHRLLEQIQGLPSVESAGAVSHLPLSGNLRFVFFCPEGQDCQGIGKDPLIALRQVSPEFFKTMRIPVLRGRAFSEQDVAGAANVVIVNDSVVRRFWPNQNPIGKHLANSRDKVPREVVGVVADLKFNTLTSPNSEEMYLPFQQVPWPNTTLVVRSSSDLQPLVAAMRQKVAQLDPDLPLNFVLTMQEVVSASVAQQGLLTGLVGVFGALALVLSAVGIYGVMSYSVTQLTHEIGIRMAVGAQPAHVFRQIVSQGMRLVLAGLALGLVGALALTRLLESVLYNVPARDPLTFAGVAALLIAVALVACCLPARRAMRVDPMIALRVE